jgi:hypothetical protein
MNLRMILLALLCSTACAPRAQPVVAGSTPTFTSRHLKSLAWLYGRWRGTQPNGNAFFEGYRLLNDSTIRTYNYADSVSVVPTDSGAISLRGGKITTGSGATIWAVSRLDDGLVVFDPVQGARNSFMWRRDSATQWTATLGWPATADRPGREVVYVMRKIGL